MHQLVGPLFTLQSFKLNNCKKSQTSIELITWLNNHKKIDWQNVRKTIYYRAQQRKYWERNNWKNLFNEFEILHLLRSLSFTVLAKNMNFMQPNHFAHKKLHHWLQFIRHWHLEILPKLQRIRAQIKILTRLQE